MWNISKSSAQIDEVTGIADRAPNWWQYLTPFLHWVISIRRHQKMSVKTRWPGHFILSTTDKLWKCKSVRRRDGAEYNYASNLKLDEMMTVKCWTLYNHKLLISARREKLQNLCRIIILKLLLIPNFLFQTSFSPPALRSPGREQEVIRVRGFVIPEWGCHKCHMSDGDSVTRVTWQSDVDDTSH